MDLGLRDRVAFVAGASSGLGRAAARAFVEAGARVALCSRSEECIQQAAAEIAGATGVGDEQLLPLACDVTDEEVVERTLRQTIERFGSLHVLLTNAGGPPAKTVTGASSWSRPGRPSSRCPRWRSPTRRVPAGRALRRRWLKSWGRRASPSARSWSTRSWSTRSWSTRSCPATRAPRR